MTLYRVTPSRLDGLNAHGQTDPNNPFHYNGKSPSFFKPLTFDTFKDAQQAVIQIKQQDKPGVWAAYIDEVTN